MAVDEAPDDQAERAKPDQLLLTQPLSTCLPSPLERQSIPRDKVRRDQQFLDPPLAHPPTHLVQVSYGAEGKHCYQVSSNLPHPPLVSYFTNLQRHDASIHPSQRPYCLKPGELLGGKRPRAVSFPTFCLILHRPTEKFSQPLESLSSESKSPAPRVCAAGPGGDQDVDRKTPPSK